MSSNAYVYLVDHAGDDMARIDSAHARHILADLGQRRATMYGVTCHLISERWTGTGKCIRRTLAEFRP